MAELTTAASPRAATGLSSRAATMACSVADVLEERCSLESGVVETAAFLREWAGTTLTGVEAPATPLHRLEARFGLTEQESDLLLLAGLPDEHEGIATTF